MEFSNKSQKNSIRSTSKHHHPLEKEEETNINFLPKRTNLPSSNQTLFSTKQCITNYYKLNLHEKLKQIYQFKMECEPNVSDHNKTIQKLIVRSIMPELQLKINIIASIGCTLWGKTLLLEPISISTSFNAYQTSYNFKLTISQTKSIRLLQQDISFQDSKAVKRILRTFTTQLLKKHSLTQLYSSRYYELKEIKVPQCDLEVIKGFKLTLCSLKTGMHLQIDNCVLIKKGNLNQQFSKKNNSKIGDQFIVGKTVIANYGRRRIYKIQRIRYDMSPQSTFILSNGQEITFQQYYQQNYGLTVTLKSQPLFEVFLKHTKESNKSKEVIKGFLIPEFVSLLGIPINQKKDPKIIKEISPYEKLTPQQKTAQTNQIVKLINSSNQLTVQGPTTVSAYQLSSPKITYTNFSSLSKNKRDDSVKVNSIQESVYLKDWILVYSIKNDQKQVDEQADQFISLLTAAKEQLRMKIQEPIHVLCEPTLKSWKSELFKEFKNRRKPQIAVLLLRPEEEQFYQELKKYITIEAEIPCQIVKKGTISKNYSLSVTSKIITQINQKIGGVAWTITPNHISISQQKVMYCGISILKGQKGLTLALVGTINKSLSRIYSYCKTDIESIDSIPDKIYNDMFYCWTKNYYKYTYSDLPDLIIVYNQGLNFFELKKQTQQQVKSLHLVTKKAQEKTKKTHYSPEIICLTSDTQTKCRIFEQTGKSYSQSFGHKLYNPSPGTVVMEDLSSNQLFDFHLAPQRTNEGTSLLTRFVVTYNKSSITQQKLVQFTYQQCYNYCNYHGGVRLPAALLYANKLAKLGHKVIQRDIIDNAELTTSFFFL